MSKNYALSAVKRDRAGKGIARALRREDKIPAVIYGDKKDPVTIALPSKEANLEYGKGQMFTTLCNLDLEGEEHLVLARDVQLHPVSDNVLHVDFLRVTAKTKITVAVPVNFENFDQSPAAKGKGILNIVRHEVDMVCQATSIPDDIAVDCGSFETGDTIKISHANLPEGSMPAITDRDFTLATIAAPRAYVEEESSETEDGEAVAEGAEGEKSEGSEASAEEAKE